MKQLTVSVAAYNVEQYLDTCLSSMADERLAEGLEVLVIDDGSKDRTAAIAEDYERRFPAIFRLIRKDNGGHGSTVNRGMAEAKGRYFRAVDGDDWVDTDAMAKLLERLKDLDTDLVVDQRRTVHMLTRAENFEPLPAGTPFDKALPFEDYTTDAYCDFFNLHTTSVKTELLRRAGVSLLENTFYVDYEYVLKATARSADVTFLDLDLYRYLVGNVAQSVDHKNYVRREDHHTRVVRELLRWDKAEREGFSPAVRRYVFRRICLLIHTHYNIDWIYDDDRRAGALRGRSFRAFLKAEYPDYAKGTGRRYRLVRALHALFVSDEKLNKLLRRG